MGRESDFIGKEIEITHLSEYTESDQYFTENMRCKILDIVRLDWESESNRSLHFILDFKPYEEYNILLTQSKTYPDLYEDNYVGNKSELLTMNFYEKGKDSIIIPMPNADCYECYAENEFEVISETASHLIEMYEKSDETNYIKFLENLALKPL